MSDEGWEDLESVLDTFEERRQLDLEARREAQQRDNEFRCVCIDVLNDTVLPTFESAARALAKRAHEGVVTKRISDYDVPSADLTIRPYVPNERWVRRSRLSLRCIAGEGLVVSGEVCSPDTDPKSISLTAPLDEVSEDWIKNQVIRFVSAVLNEYQ